MFVFGTQYLRGTTPERDQWKRDMESMKNLGFNTIRGWLVWNCVERREGEIDYEYISEFLNCAAQFDLQVGLLFHLHACPYWAVESHSDYFYKNQDNLPFEPAIRANTPSGGWPGLCFDHPEVREMEKHFITGVMSETRKHANVAFYEPMNEPHQWVDHTKDPIGIFCYCEATIAKFRLWLQKKYRDIHTLNDAWGYAYSDFSQVRPPRWAPSYSDYIDFRLFTIDNIAEEIQFRTDIIRTNDNKPVIAHAWGGGCVTCPQLGGMAFDDWKNARIFDKWGYSAFPRTEKDCCVLGLGCDSTRCAADGKDYWQSELSAGLVGGVLKHSGRISDQLFDQFSLESIRHGAKGLLYWQYRKERIGAETGGFSMTDYDGGPTNLTKKAGQLGAFLASHGHILEQGESKAAEVALVFSIRSYLADWCVNSRQSNKFAVDSMSGYYRMFWEENIPVDVIHESFHSDLSRYKLIILPTAIAIDPEFVRELETYIRNGGTVLSEHSFGLFAETFKLSYQVPGYGFNTIFGAHEDDILQKSDVVLTDGAYKYALGKNRYTETFADVKSNVLYRYEDGSPAIIANDVGSGRAILSGVNLGFAYSSGQLVGDDFAGTDLLVAGASKKIVQKLCHELHLDKNICSAPDVKVSVIRSGVDMLVILINSAKERRQGIITLPALCECGSTVYGSCDWESTGNRLQFSLDGSHSAVIRLLVQ